MRKVRLFIVLIWIGGAYAQNADSAKLFEPVLKDSMITPLAVDSSRVVPVMDSAAIVKPVFVQYQDSGIASWYGPNWEGRLTASGEYFSPDSMTAAHKWLPFGTIVKVTNLSNDSVIYVRITDRLPKSSKRSLDLTPVAAKRLGFYSKGLQKVRMETVGITPVKRKTKSLSGRK